MKITITEIFLIVNCIIPFVSSENVQSPSPILPTSHSKQESINQHNQNRLSSISLNYLKRKQLKNITKRFLKRFQVDLSTINHGTNYLPSSSQREYQSIDLDNKPSIDSSPSSSPKLLSIDLSVLDRPLTIPMIYYDDFEDLSFPRDSRSNEIEDNYYSNNRNNHNSFNSYKFPHEESTDGNDDMPNEIPLDPVYSDENEDDLMVNDQHELHFNQFPEHLSTGNDALADYLNDLKSSTNRNQFKNILKQNNHFRQLESSYPTESVHRRFQKFGYPNTIIDLFPIKSNNYIDRYSPLTPIHQQFANWLRNDQPGSLMTNYPPGKSETHENDGVQDNPNKFRVNYHQPHQVIPPNKGLIVDKSILMNHLHHHQHQLPSSFKSSFSSAAGFIENDKIDRSVDRVANSLNNNKPIK